MKSLRILFRRKKTSRVRESKAPAIPAEPLQQEHQVNPAPPPKDEISQERHPISPESGFIKAVAREGLDPAPRLYPERDPELTDSLPIEPYWKMPQLDLPAQTLHKPEPRPVLEWLTPASKARTDAPSSEHRPAESPEQPLNESPGTSDATEESVRTLETKNRKPIMSFIREEEERPGVVPDDAPAKQSEAEPEELPNPFFLQSIEAEPLLRRPESPRHTNGDEKPRPASTPVHPIIDSWIGQPAPLQDQEPPVNGSEREPGRIPRRKSRNPIGSFVERLLARARSECGAEEGPNGRHDHLDPFRLDSSCKPDYTQTRIVPVREDHLKSNRIVTFDEHDPVTDQFKLLRTLVFQQMRPKGWNTIQVAGFDSGEGSSLVAANLAISIAKDVRQTALLVDLNFRNPSIERLLHLDCEFGLKSYFLDGIGLERILVNPAIGKLTVMPAGGKITHAPELMGSPKMQQLVKELKERYADRYIIFDTPAVSSYPDALVFSEYVDAIILVARVDRTTHDNVRSTVDLIPREKILGVVLNDSQELV